jgi:hypothetical protein
MGALLPMTMVYILGLTSQVLAVMEAYYQAAFLNWQLSTQGAPTSAMKLLQLENGSFALLVTMVKPHEFAKQSIKSNASILLIKNLRVAVRR